METRTLIIIIAVIFTLVVAVPILGKIAKDNREFKEAEARRIKAEEEAKKRAEEAKKHPKPASPIPGIQLPPGVPKAPPGQPQRVAVEVQGGAAPMLNAQNLAGSQWAIMGGTVDLMPGGVARVNHPNLQQLAAGAGIAPEMVAQMATGSWTVMGNWLRINGAMGSVEVQIVGMQLIGPQGPIMRTR